MRVIDGQSAKTYRVRWEIDIDANTPRQAAQRAQVIMQDKSEDNLATVFQVYERLEPVKIEEIDLACTCDPESDKVVPASEGCPQHTNRPKLSVNVQEGYE